MLPAPLKTARSKRKGLSDKFKDKEIAKDSSSIKGFLKSLSISYELDSCC